MMQSKEKITRANAMDILLKAGIRMCDEAYEDLFLI